MASSLLSSNFLKILHSIFYLAGHEYNAPTLRMPLAVVYLLQEGTVSADRELRPAVSRTAPGSPEHELFQRIHIITASKAPGGSVSAPPYSPCIGA